MVARYVAGLCLAALAHADRQAALARAMARAAGDSGAACEYWRMVAASGRASAETQRWRRPAPRGYSKEETNA